jgi:sigma-B regulation protein RsbU (phosphoserine phosphatase)
MFVTVFLGILDLRTGAVTYSNAGHNPPYLQRSDGSLKRLDARHGPIVGAMEGIAYRESKESLEAGDLAFLYTDGVTEAMDIGQQLYSEERLKQLLAPRKFESAEDAVATGVADVWRFQGDAEQADDVTVLAVVYSGPQEDTDVHELELAAANRLEEIERVNQAFNDFAERYEIPVALRRKLNIVFDELLNNIITYAYEDDDEHIIDLHIRLVGDRITATITDDGKPFNPFEKERPDTSLSVDDRPIGGLGVHLVRSVMDRVSYERRGEKNVVILEGRIEPN